MGKLRWYKIDIQIPEDDFIREVEVAGKKLCLVGHLGKLHLLHNSCPHAGGIMSDGWCKNGQIVCPIHRYSYNLEDGRGAEGQGDYLHVYPLKQETDGVYAGFPQSLLSRIFGKD